MISRCLLFVQLLLVAWMVDAGLDVHDDFAIRPRTITCRNPYGNEPDPVEKCSHWFYQCDSDYGGQLSLCQENLYYDWVQMECDHFTNVPECTGATRGPIRTTIRPQVTTIDQTLFDCTKADDGNYADQRGTTIDGKLIPYCSNRFFTCTNGILVGKYCQFGYYYDQVYDWCGSLDQVFACNGGIRVTRPPTTLAPRLTTEDLHFSCVNKPSGDYPNPLDKCSHFYISCSGAIATKVLCPANLFFNRESGRCDDREAVFDCTGVRRTTLLPPTFGTVAPYYFNCTGLVNDRMYNNPDERCGHTFFQCSNGIGVKETCADSTYFDYESQLCLVREYVFECTGVRRPSTTFVPIISTSPSYYFNCTGLKDGGMYPNPLESCSHIFYECSNGYGWQKYCAAESTYFDIYSQSCNYKKYVPACNGGFTRPVEPSTTTTPFVEPVTRFTLPDQRTTHPHRPTRSHRPARLRTTTAGKTEAPTTSTSTTVAPTEKPLPTSTVTHGKARLRTTTSHPTPSTTTVKTSSHGPARLRTTSENPLRSSTVIQCKHPYGNESDPQEKCSHWFYQCNSNYIGQRTLCHENLYYDWVQMKCDSYGNIPECIGATRGPTEITITSKSATVRMLDSFRNMPSVVDLGTHDNFARHRLTIQCKNPYGSEPDPVEKCSHWFYQCDKDYVGKVILCQENLYYDWVQMKCDNYTNIPECTGATRGPSGTTIIPKTVALHMLDDIKNDASITDAGIDNNVQIFDASFSTQDDFTSFENVSLRADAGIDVHDHMTRRPPTIQCKLPYGNEPDPMEKCSHWFYLCDSEYVGQLYLCQENLYYDWVQMECDHYTNVPECTGATRGPIQTTITLRTTTFDQLLFDCTRINNGNYADERGTVLEGERRIPYCANRYFQCSNGKLIVKHCQSGYFYDQTIDQCGSLDEVFACNGGNRVTRTPLTLAPRLTTTEDIQFSCKNQPVGNYPNPVDKCSHFYISCGDGGIATKVICPVNTFYNRENGRCDDREAVFECTGVRLTTTVGPLTRVTVAPYFFNCTGLENGKMYNNPDERCSRTFFQCANGIGFKVICADSTYFDFSSQICLQRDNVYECTGVHRQSTTIGPPTISTAATFFNCTGLQNGKMYPNPLESCSNIFFKCSNEYGWKMYCPAVATYFDFENQSCNYKKRVPACNGGLTRPMEPSTRFVEPTTRFTLPDQPITRSHRPARLRTMTTRETVSTVAPTTSTSITDAATKKSLLTSTTTHGRARLRTTTNHSTSSTLNVKTSTHGPARHRTTKEDSLRSSTGRARPRTTTTGVNLH